MVAEAQAFESRFARNGRGAPSGEVPPLKAQSGQTGKGDAAPLILPAQDPSLGQDESVPFAPGDNGWRGDPAQETYVRDGATQSLTSRFGSSGTDYPDAEAGWLVAGQEPDPTGGQELSATLKGQRGKGGGGIGPEETLLPVDEATGFYSTGGTRGVSGNEGESPALKVGSGLGIPSPPAVFSKRHAASDAEDSETWDESEQAHTLNQNMNAPDVAADAQAVRRLTPTEAERLQGLPDSWTLPYGPSLADAPAWHDLRTPPSPLRAVTINEGNDTPQGSVWESDQCGSLATGGGKPGQGYHAVRTEADPTWIGLDNANRGNDHVKEGEPNAEALRAKGTLDQAIFDSPPLTAAGFHGNADGSDDQVEATALAFEARYYSDRERMGGAPSGEAGPVKATDSKAGDAAQVVAFAQNQREELRELDEASSLSGQGTHQTTYVAGAIAAVAEGTARPFDCPPDGSRYAALGDAVTASVSRWLGERLAAVLSEVGCIKDGCVNLTADLEPNEQGEYVPRAGAHSFGKLDGANREAGGNGNL